MVKIFITLLLPPSMNSEECRLLDIHAFLNILKIITLLCTRDVLFWFLRSSTTAGSQTLSSTVIIK